MTYNYSVASFNEKVVVSGGCLEFICIITFCKLKITINYLEVQLVNNIRNEYILQRINSTQDKLYIEALKIYNKNTPPDIKTNTNEITHWVQQNDVNVHFEVIPFALLIDNQVVGFLMVSYLKKNMTIIIEYIALLDQYRVNVVFFSFMNLMKNYFSTEGYDIRYYIVEISNKNDGKSIDKESLFFMKFLCLEGYGKLDTIYKTLPLGINDCESSFSAFLYIKSNDSLTTISKSTYLSLVHEIYFNYFQNWYKTTMTNSDFEIYKKIVSNQYFELEKNLAKEEYIDITYSSCLISESSLDFNTHIAIPSKVHSKKIVTIPLIAMIILLLPVFIVFLYSHLLIRLGVDSKLINSILGPIFTAITTGFITLIISKNKL